MSPTHCQSGTRRRARLVLVVDDDVANRETVCEILTDAGYVVLEAPDGAEALQLLVAEGAPEPSVIVLDVQMPRMSGPELVRELRSNGRLAQIPVILTSGGPRLPIADGEEEPEWLPKPFDAERLLDLVREACDAKRGRAEDRSRCS